MGKNILAVDQFESIFPDWTAVRDRYSDVFGQGYASQERLLSVMIDTG